MRVGNLCLQLGAKAMRSEFEVPTKQRRVHILIQSPGPRRSRRALQQRARSHPGTSATYVFLSDVAYARIEHRMLTCHICSPLALEHASS